jgi:lipopolysaccharide assembly outer membrane protein LptD (OstA)
MISLLGGIMVNLLAGDPGQKRKIELPVPIGHEVKGLRVPVRNAKGQMQLQLDTESATRLDNSNIQMRSVSIQTFDEETAKPDFKIELKTANLNTDTNIITSDEPVLVTRSDFVLTGDSMEFNRDTNQGIMKGNVRMLVYNRQEFQTKSQISGRQQ